MAAIERTLKTLDDKCTVKGISLPNFLQLIPLMAAIEEAENGQDAIALNEHLRPDVITMDVCMPIMDGLTALKHIMIRQPTPVVMVSTLTRDGAWETFEALRLGAVDFIDKPNRLARLGPWRIPARTVPRQAPRTMTMPDSWSGGANRLEGKADKNNQAAGCSRPILSSFWVMVSRVNGLTI